MKVEESSLKTDVVTTITVEKNGVYEVNGVKHEPSVSVQMLTGASKLRRQLLESKDLIVCPGVYDGLSARIAIQLGFKALYMTGAGTTASRLGMADLGLAQLHDMRTNAEMIASLDPFGPPLIADMDTGYGGPLMVAKSVQQYIQAGVAGFHIEDQVQNKRCGHLAGKKVVSLDEYLIRIRAAKRTKDRLHSDIVLIARTDALQQHGYDECIRRLKAAQDLGADVGLLEGFTSKEQARQAVQDLAPWPLLLNMVENGAGPVITTQEAQEMGFRIMIFSFASLAPAYLGIKAALERLKTHGIVGTPEGVGPKKLFELFALTTLLTQLTLGAIIPVHLESRACAYTCGSRCYTSSEVSAAQHTGCNLYSSNDDVSDYPHEYHKYEGFDFPAPGEYHEFPIMRNGDTYDGGSPGTDRVIFNMDDQLAGVIKHTGASENEFVACTQ